VIKVRPGRFELPDRCLWNVPVRLTTRKLKIGDIELDPEAMPHMEVVITASSLPREAMGLGDVKFMAAIGRSSAGKPRSSP